MAPKKKDYDSALISHIRAVIALIKCTDTHCKKEQDELERNKKLETNDKESELKRNACNQKYCISAIRWALKSLRVLAEEKKSKRTELGLLSAGINNQIRDIDKFLAFKKGFSAADLRKMHIMLSLSLLSAI